MPWSDNGAGASFFNASPHFSVSHRQQYVAVR